MPYHDKNLREIIASTDRGAAIDEILKGINLPEDGRTNLPEGGGCDVVLFITGSYASGIWHVWRYDHGSQTKIPMVGDNSRLGPSIAMWDNKFYTINRDCTNPALYNAVIEYEFDPIANTYFYVRDIQLNYPGYTSFTCGAAYSLTMKNANTILLHEKTGDPFANSANTNAPFVVLDISGSSTTLVQPIFGIGRGPGGVDFVKPMGDMVYYSSNDTVLLSVTGDFSPFGAPQFTTTGFILMELMTGNVLDFVCSNWPVSTSITSIIGSEAIYKYNNKTFVAGQIMNPLAIGGTYGITELIVTGSTITLGNTWDPTQFSNPGNDPNAWFDADSSCVRRPAPPPIKTYDCVNGNCVAVMNIGAYTSLSACQQYCGDGGWNCKTITNIGQPGSYQTCVQVSLPITGTYATLLDCQNGFINGGFGPCKKPTTIPTLGSKLAQSGGDKPKKLHKGITTCTQSNIKIGNVLKDLTPEGSVKSPIMHWWRVCAYVNAAVPSWGWTPINPPYYTTLAWFQNPLNTAFGGNMQEAFYQHIISTVVDANTGTVGVPSLNVGDQITWDLVPNLWWDPGGVCFINGYPKMSRICIEYMGKENMPSVINWWGFLTQSLAPPYTYIINEFCCQYPVRPTPSYDCKDGVCITVPSPGIGPFTSLSACQQHCGKTWDCLEKPKFTQDEWAAIGVGGSIPTAYSCQEVFWPNIGTYATKQDCLDVCSASYTTYG